MSRLEVTGNGVSPGIAIGEPVVYETRPVAALRIPVDEEGVEEEIATFRAAVEETVRRIGNNAAKAREEMGEEYASIFEAHALIARDPSFLESVERIIRTEQVNAEWALDQVLGELVARFENLGDLYFEDRKLDVLDVLTQILQTLRGQDLRKLGDLDHPVVIVADDLPPSLAVQLPLEKILGFALEMGGPTSHTTIIARSFGIPAAVGVHGACEAARTARRVILDGFEGKLVLDPDPVEVKEYESHRREYEERQAHLARVRTLPTVTRDGHKVELHANIDLPMEVDAALEWNVDGIGLYRSEFLYMKASPRLPSEEEHLAFYTELVRRMAPRPVTIRTFDLGGKKLARDVIGSPEANPVLGLRGIRLCLAKPDFFITQLRALLRVAAQFPPGTVRIMIPLISGVEEMRITRKLLAEVADDLRSEGHEVLPSVPLGAMVEVPSAAVLARQLVREVDFVSIGTNDLTQYTLAVDRANELVADLYRTTHPGVLRLVREVIRAGEAEGIEVSMCGEAAADPLMVPLLIGLGLRKFSTNPQAIPVVRNLVRHLSYRETGHLARQAMSLATAREVEEYLLERLAIFFAKIKIHV